MAKNSLLFMLLTLLCIPGIFAEEPESSQMYDFWFNVGWDTAMYSESGMANGSSYAIGYGDGAAIGIRAAFFSTPERINALELNVLFRLYFRGSEAFSGPFIQFTGGPVLFFPEEKLLFQLGTISAGLNLGLRFLLLNGVFFEPVIRAGFPYFLGIGLSAGISFKQIAESSEQRAANRAQRAESREQRAKSRAENREGREQGAGNSE